MNGEHAMGIDLGTTCCCVSIYRFKRVEVMVDGNDRTMPSYMSFDSEGRSFGKAAKENAFYNPTGTIFGIKRIIGRPFTDPRVQEYKQRWAFPIIEKDGFPVIQVEDGGLPVMYSPTQISSLILAELKRMVDTFLSEDVKKAVITVPANFNENQRRATKEAGERAGLEVIGIINEPTAAALAYGFQQPKTDRIEQTILVFDFGGGTLDVAILRISKGYQFKVLASSGEMSLGGEDIDDLLVDHFVKEYKAKNGTDLSEKPEVIAQLRTKVENAKKALSFGDRPAQVTLSHVDGPKHLKSSISRSVLEGLCETIFAGILRPVDLALRQASLSRAEIDTVLLVGGSSRIPKINEILQNHFPDTQIMRDINPDEAISAGAAIYAQLKLGNNDLEEVNLVIEDIIPFSLGFRVRGDKMCRVIEKGAHYPVTSTRHVTTATRIGGKVEILMYEGENTMITENNFLGKLILSNIRLINEDPRIAVTFSYDAFGCLNVSATEEITGTTVKAVIDSCILGSSL